MGTMDALVDPVTFANRVPDVSAPQDSEWVGTGR
jgi:hypothetical protein